VDPASEGDADSSDYESARPYDPHDHADHRATTSSRPTESGLNSLPFVLELIRQLARNNTPDFNRLNAFELLVTRYSQFHLVHFAEFFAPPPPELNALPAFATSYRRAARVRLDALIAETLDSDIPHPRRHPRDHHTKTTTVASLIGSPPPTESWPRGEVRLSPDECCYWVLLGTRAIAVQERVTKSNKRQPLTNIKHYDLITRLSSPPSTTLNYYIAAEFAKAPAYIVAAHHVHTTWLCPRDVVALVTSIPNPIDVMRHIACGEITLAHLTPPTTYNLRHDIAAQRAALALLYDVVVYIFGEFEYAHQVLKLRHTVERAWTTNPLDHQKALVFDALQRGLNIWHEQLSSFVLATMQTRTLLGTTTNDFDLSATVDSQIQIAHVLANIPRPPLHPTSTPVPPPPYAPRPTPTSTTATSTAATAAGDLAIFNERFPFLVGVKRPNAAGVPAFVCRRFALNKCTRTSCSFSHDISPPAPGARPSTH
jgi:hypothetical protein